MEKPIGKIADEVCDEKSFLEFAKALEADRRRAVKAERLNPSNPYGPDAGGWENVSIENFLNAGISWAEDSEFRHIPASNPWKRFAIFLYAGKFYE
jgi:hypothetical protein